MAKAITQRQLEVYNFILGYINEHQYPPTVSEIGDHFGFSVKAAYDHTKVLEKKGYITIEPNSARAIRTRVSNLSVMEVFSDGDNGIKKGDFLIMNSETEQPIALCREL